jgi:hypothetical protein
MLLSSPYSDDGVKVSQHDVAQATAEMLANTTGLKLTTYISSCGCVMHELGEQIIIGSLCEDEPATT